MRLHRFYVNKPLGEEIVVENVDGGKELIHQLTHVFRYTSGDEVFLFSSFNLGLDFLYRISSISKQTLSLVPVSTTSNILPKGEVTLVMALVKKDTFETVVRQATELGVSRIIPLIADRSEKKNLNRERMRAISIEASEQSGRGTLPEITEIMTMEGALAATVGSLRIIGSLQGERATAFEPILGKTSLWVGPEGGWTDKEELVAKEHGFHALKLGETALKADTAAVTLLSNYLALSSDN